MISLVRSRRFLALLSLLSAGWTFLRRQKSARMTKLERQAFYDRIWREAAADLGAEVADADGLLEIRDSDVQVRVRANYTTLDDPVTLMVAGDKPRVHRLLVKAGLPTPAFVEFDLDDFDSAVRFLESAKPPCVVKPARGTSSGQGVTTGIRRRWQLFWAAIAAARFHGGLMIQHEIAGQNLRLLLLDGRLLDAVRRDPPCVTGDGKTTIRQLVKRENQCRAAGLVEAQTLLEWDSEMRHTLSAQRLAWDSIPAAGRRVLIKTVVNENAARETHAATADVCPSIIDAANQAARCVGARLAGVDVITPDPSLPLSENGGVILEVNTTPGLYHHKRGNSCPVAVPILAAMLESRRRIMDHSP